MKLPFCGQLLEASNDQSEAGQPTPQVRVHNDNQSNSGFTEVQVILSHGVPGTTTVALIITSDFRFLHDSWSFGPSRDTTASHQAAKAPRATQFDLTWVHASHSELGPRHRQ